MITFSPLFLIGSFSYLQIMRTCIRAWMSSKFGQMRPLVSMATDRVTAGKTVSSYFLEHVKCWFSHDAAQILSSYVLFGICKIKVYCTRSF